MNTLINTHFLTLNEAAEQVGRSKGTISKAVKDGRLSVHSKQGKTFNIDPIELDRWNKAYPVRNRHKNQQKTEVEQIETPKNTNENIDLLVELATLREKLASLETSSAKQERTLSDQVDDLRQRLDESERERRTKDAEMKALTDQRIQAMEQPEPQGIFKKLFGVG